MQFHYRCKNCGASFHGEERSNLSAEAKKKLEKKKELVLSLDCSFCESPESLELLDSYGSETYYDLNDKRTWKYNERKVKVSKYLDPTEKAVKQMIDKDGYLPTNWMDRLEAMRGSKKSRKEKTNS